MQWVTNSVNADPKTDFTILCCIENLLWELDMLDHYEWVDGHFVHSAYSACLDHFLKTGSQLIGDRLDARCLL